MKTRLNWTLLAALGLAVTGSALRADDIGKKVTDPVTMKQVTVAKETPMVLVNGTALYFADAKSRDTFLKTPETYLKTPVECPVRGVKAKASKTTRSIINDQIVYFCCAGCAGSFKNEPNNFLSKLTDPVSGKEFNLLADSPKSEHRGGVYYFESAENKAAFDKEPAKYAKVTLQ